MRSRKDEEGGRGDPGRQLPSLALGDEEVTPRLASPPLRRGRPRPHLIAIGGARMGEIFPVEERLLIGRAEGAGLRLVDDKVSRRHAEVSVLGDGVLRLLDLGSTNGTYVRGERVRACLLRRGDRLALGDGHLLRAAWLDPIEERFYRQLQDGALKDVLTPAYNRRYLQQRLETELAFAQRHGTPVALLVIDVDHFKQVNDRFGHPIGDEVLRRLAETLQKELRSEDVLARWGGEEFAVLAHSTPDMPALILGERIRHRVAATRFQHGQPLHVSIGIAVYPSEPLPALPARPMHDDASAEASMAAELIGSADQALYHAKSRGRNQVVSSTEVWVGGGGLAALVSEQGEARR